MSESKKIQTIDQKNKLALIREKEWFNEYIDKAQGYFVEINNHSWDIIFKYHALGKYMEENKINFVDGGYSLGEMEQITADQVGRSTRTIRSARRFYNTYPDLEKSPYTTGTQWIQVLNDLKKGEKKELGSSEDKETVEFEASKNKKPEPPIILTWNKADEAYDLTIADPEALDLINFGEDKDVLLSYLENR